MNVRSYVIVAAIVTAASILPAAANAAGARAPVHTHGAFAGQTRVHTTGFAGDTSTALTLQQRLNLVKRTNATLTKQLRTLKAGSARVGGNLRATKTLVAKLRAEIAANGQLINELWAEIGRLRGPLPPPPPPTDYDKCMTNMDDCTAEMLCSIYGMDCHLVPVTPVEPTPIVETPVEESADDSIKTSDSSQELVPVEAPAAFDPYGYDEEC